jgi:ACT domain.
MASGATSLSVNLPEIALPAGSGTHRLVHLHRNVPGVLASINRVLAEHGVNVEGQLLRTRDDYGYVLTDISFGVQRGRAGRAERDARHHPPAHPPLALRTARLTAA